MIHLILVLWAGTISTAEPLVMPLYYDTQAIFPEVQAYKLYSQKTIPFPAKNMMVFQEDTNIIINCSNITTSNTFFFRNTRTKILGIFSGRFTSYINLTKKNHRASCPNTDYYILPYPIISDSFIINAQSKNSPIKIVIDNEAVKYYLEYYSLNLTENQRREENNFYKYLYANPYQSFYFDLKPNEVRFLKYKQKSECLITFLISTNHITNVTLGRFNEKKFQAMSYTGTFFEVNQASANVLEYFIIFSNKGKITTKISVAQYPRKHKVQFSEKKSNNIDFSFDYVIKDIRQKINQSIINNTFKNTFLKTPQNTHQSKKHTPATRIPRKNNPVDNEKEYHKLRRPNIEIGKGGIQKIKTITIAPTKSLRPTPSPSQSMQVTPSMTPSPTFFDAMGWKEASTFQAIVKRHPIIPKFIEYEQGDDYKEINVLGCGTIFFSNIERGDSVIIETNDKMLETRSDSSIGVNLGKIKDMTEFVVMAATKNPKFSYYCTPDWYNEDTFILNPPNKKFKGDEIEISENVNSEIQKMKPHKNLHISDLSLFEEWSVSIESGARYIFIDDRYSCIFISEAKGYEFAFFSKRDTLLKKEYVLRSYLKNNTGMRGFNFGAQKGVIRIQKVDEDANPINIIASSRYYEYDAFLFDVEAMIQEEKDDIIGNANDILGEEEPVMPKRTIARRRLKPWETEEEENLENIALIIAAMTVALVWTIINDLKYDSDSILDLIL